MAQTSPYIWGGVDENGNRLNQAETLENVKLNQNTDALLERVEEVADTANAFAQDDETTGLLTWGWKAGRVRYGADVLQVLAGSIALTASATNYVEINPATGILSVNTAGFSASKFALRRQVCDAASITTNDDCRTWVTLPSPPANNSITDVMIGDRAANDTDASTSNTGSITALFSRGFYRIKTVVAALAAHIADTANPHAVTKAQVGLGNVTNDAQLKAASNLSDVASAATARGNLGLGDAVTLNGTALATGFKIVVRDINGRAQFADPFSSADAATKNYVDTLANDLSARMGAPVQDFTALRAVNTTSIGDKQLRLVEDEGATFRFDSAGTGTDDNSTIITPTTGPGRWFKAQAATQNHNALIGLQGGNTNDYQHLTTAQLAKLVGIASGATANATDAQLRDRNTHTGTQAHTTVTGLGNAATKNVGVTSADVAAGDHTHGKNITRIVNQLDYNPNTNLANPLNLTTDVWADLTANQNFPVTNSITSSVRIQIRGSAGCSVTSGIGVCSVRAVIDSAGTAINKMVSAPIVNSTTSTNIFQGNGEFILTGLTAGTHTIKIQAETNATGAVYLRALSFPDFEFSNVIVDEHIPVAI